MDTESKNALIQAAQSLLDGVRGRDLSPVQLAQHAIPLAASLLKLSAVVRSTEEKTRLELLGRMMADPAGQLFTTLLADRALRATSPALAIDQARYLMGKLGPPQYLSSFDRLQLGALRGFGSLAPGLAAKGMLKRVHHEASSYVVVGDAERLAAYIAERAVQGISVNVNHLGEEVISEHAAQQRTNDYIELLRAPNVTTISVKISSICSQISVVAFEPTVETLAARLGLIYQAAQNHDVPGEPSKLVYLDMEAHRDVSVTIEAFKRALSEPRFQKLQAGIVLQAYLPDAITHQQDLLNFARQRCEQGGAPLRLRIVKGANLAMERVESEQRGWALPTFGTKRETDANYKRMLLLGTRPDNAACLHLGVASHNIFDISNGLLLCSTRAVEPYVTFELLEGMANSLCLALIELGAQVLVYAPFVAEDELPSALAYLVRRLDENTSKENFLRSGFAMRVGDSAWQLQKRLYLDSVQPIEGPESTSGREGTSPVLKHDEPFRNEPDTDFVAAASRAALATELRRVHAARFLVESCIPDAPAEYAEEQPGFDPSRPSCVPYRIRLATPDAIDRALQNAVAAQARLQAMTIEKRVELLQRVATNLRLHRHELVALMVLDAGKRVEEADSEVSEAIDFAEYYPRSYVSWARTPNVRLRPRGPTIVVPPWNFPLAIPLGGVFAALAAGNAVILKPALEAALVAQRGCELCWEAGVPRDVLQLVVCSDEVGSTLITDPRTQVVVLTGSTETAQLFHKLRPDVSLLAETGGKNALYVSPMADREQAIADTIHSAFGHSGQKCSALSLLILHHSLYDDDTFLEALREAARSLPIGSAWDLDSKITPLIQLPGPIQKRALTELMPGESWLLQPKFDPLNPRLVSPGIKLGVSPGSFSHQTECFCPVVAVLRAQDLACALRIANGTKYGLTAGIHSLDEREQVAWLQGCKAGNLYVNRRITGAVVGRQPFGGWKDSSFGPGSKAGGPTYVAQLVTPHAFAAPQAAVDSSSAGAFLRGSAERLVRGFARLLDEPARDRLLATALAYQRSYVEHYASAFVGGSVRGEDNWLRWVAPEGIFIVADADTSVEMLARSAIAAALTGARHSVLIPQAGPCAQAQDLLEAETYANISEIADKLRRADATRVRYLGMPSLDWYKHLTDLNCHTAHGLPTACGRFELLHFLREQSWSICSHRYGNLIPNSLKVTSALLGSG